MARALMAGVKCKPSGRGYRRSRLDLRTSRIPMAVSRTREEENILKMAAKMKFPILRIGGILLSAFSRQPRTTSAFSDTAVLHSGGKNLGTQVPSAPREPSRSGSDCLQASLIDAP